MQKISPKRSHSSKSTALADALTQLLRLQACHNHEELCNRLKAKGFEVTQSTVSRMLHKLRAVKGLNANNELVYLLPSEANPSHDHSTSSASSHASSHLVLSIEHNEQVIIIHTLPGSANIIALLIDANRLNCHLLGTIAGDDTILAVPSSVHSLHRSLGAIKALLASR